LEHQGLERAVVLAHEHHGRRRDGVALLTRALAQPTLEVGLLRHGVGRRGWSPAARYTSSITSMLAIASASVVGYGAPSCTAAAKAFSWYQYVASPLTFSLRRDLTPDRGSRVSTTTRWKYCGPVMFVIFMVPSVPSTEPPRLKSLRDSIA